MAWPLVLMGQAATMELLQAQFRESERLQPEQIRARQRLQVDQLAAHAHAQSPFWQAIRRAAGGSRRCRS
jgi:hypothetical protein